MLADIMPNILALAPYESVFGLACSCRALSRTTIERAQYEIETPMMLDEGVAGTMRGYPNGWRLSLRTQDAETDGFTVDASYWNNVPRFAYINDDMGLTVASLETGVCCVIKANYIGVGGGGMPSVIVGLGGVAGDETLPGGVAVALAGMLQPLFDERIDSDSLIGAVIRAINYYARRIGNANDTLISKYSEALGNVLHERLQWN